MPQHPTCDSPVNVIQAHTCADATPCTAPKPERRTQRERAELSKRTELLRRYGDRAFKLIEADRVVGWRISSDSQRAISAQLDRTVILFQRGVAEETV